VTIETKDAVTQISFTVSIGVTVSTGSEINYKEMLRSADQALYQAKENGRNNTTSAVPFTNSCDDEKVDEQPILENEMASLKSFNEGNDMTANITANEGSDDDSELPGIDYSIGVNNVLGDEGLFEEILLMFYQDHGNDKANIQQAIENQDQAQLKHLVHTLKGVATSIGAMELFSLAKCLDIAVNHEESESYQTLFVPLAFELDKVFNGVKRKIAAKL